MNFINAAAGDFSCISGIVDKHNELNKNNSDKEEPMADLLELL